MMTSEMNSYINPKIQLKTGVMVMFGLSFTVLCMVFGMSVLAPYPLSMIILLYGRKKGYFTGAISCLILYQASKYFHDITFIIMGATSFVLAILICEMIYRKVDPIKGFLKFGFGYVLTVSLATVAIFSITKSDPKKFVIDEIINTPRVEEFKNLLEKEGDQQSFQTVALLAQPEKFAQEIIDNAPAGFFIISFFMIWLNLMLMIKTCRLVLVEGSYPFTVENLLKFRLPDQVVWFVILVFALMLWGDEYVMPGSSYWGGNLLKCSLVFYLFQGFSLYNDFLNFMGVTGVIRTFLVVFMVGFLNWMIAIVGLFDVFLNFRQYLVKKEQ